MKIVQVLLALVAGALATHAADNRSPLDDRVRALRAELGAAFTVVAEAPFVVVGDEAAKVVRQRGRDTIRMAVRLLKQDFFARDPDELITIWLFRDDASYRRNLRERFGEPNPTTPYGYYSPRHRALFMNIATGGGTLVHEIVHPFMRANFPQCPSWFDEGLASLFEQSAQHDGHLVGLVNWRLPALQEQIRAGTLPTFREFTNLSTAEFYGRDNSASPRSHYPQARYLCLYLQEKELLRDFYTEFVAHVAEDPTGYATLQRVLGTEDMDAFTREWTAWVQALRFPVQ